MAKPKKYTPTVKTFVISAYSAEDGDAATIITALNEREALDKYAESDGDGTVLIAEATQFTEYKSKTIYVNVDK